MITESSPTCSSIGKICDLIHRASARNLPSSSARDHSPGNTSRVARDICDTSGDDQYSGFIDLILTIPPSRIVAARCGGGSGSICA